MSNYLKEQLEKLSEEEKEKLITTVSFVDYDELYKKTMDSDNPTAFLLDERINYNTYLEKDRIEDIRKINEINSIYSYKFGISMYDEESVIDHLYTCNCGELKGIDQLDFICPHCGSPVERKEPKKIGWFVLNNFKIIHPFILFILFKERSPIERPEKKTKKSNSSLANKNLVKEEKPEEENDDDPTEEELELGGSLTEKEEEEPKEEKRKGKKPKKNKEQNYTFMEALTYKKLKYSWADILNPNGEKLQEFIETYLPRRKALLMRYRHLWYTNKILVISKNYRFYNIKEIEVVGSNESNNHPLNILYMNISNAVKELNESPYDNPISFINDHLTDICRHLAVVVDHLFRDIAVGKKSYIRGEVYGKKYTYSARLVIESIIDPNIHEIDVCQLPIDVFRVIFAPDVVNIAKELHMYPSKIRDLVNIDYTLSEIDKDIIRNDIFPRVVNPVIYTNREPDIYVTSILALKVHSLIDEMVLRIPFFILVSISGDFDRPHQLSKSLI